MHGNTIKKEIRWYEKSLKGSLEILPKYEAHGLNDCIAHAKRNIERCERNLSIYRQCLTMKPSERLNFIIENRNQGGQ